MHPWSAAERGLAPRSAAERGFNARTPEMVLTQPASVVQGALHRVRGLLEDRPLRLNVGDESNYMWTFVQRIRRKIEPDRAHTRYVLTEAGVAYRMPMPGEEGHSHI